MTSGIGGYAASVNLSVQMSVKKSAEAAGGAERIAPRLGVPTYTNKTYNSLAEFSGAVQTYRREWQTVYEERFSSMENGGKLSVEALMEDMRREFAAFGVQFTDRKPREPVQGKHLVYIDEANLAKMAADPKYRAENYALMQREFVSINNPLTYRDARGETVRSQLTGTLFTLSDDNPLEGGSRYHGGCTATTVRSGDSTSSAGGGGGGKSMLARLMERIEEMQKLRMERAEQARVEKEKQEAAQLAREQAKEALGASGNATEPPPPIVKFDVTA
jgi:hypothetical protein